MPLKADEVELLRQIKNAYLSHDGLWAILTALRGPDKDYLTTQDSRDPNRFYPELIEVKAATTLLVRARVFGINHRVVTIYSAPRFLGDNQELLGIRNNLNFDHFTEHARVAFKSLGLKWEEVNSIELFEEGI